MMLFELKILDSRLSEWGFPRYGSDEAAGLDLFCCVEDELCLLPGISQVISAGFALSFRGHALAGFILPRSGTGSRGIVMGNGTGLIDPDYRGEIKICLLNRTDSTITVRPGDRVAQMVFLPFFRPLFQQVPEFSASTSRGAGGFGSTGS